MIYRLDNFTCEITEATIDETRDALDGFGWSKEIQDELFRGAKLLYTSKAHFCRFPDRLEDLLRDLSPTAPAPYGTAQIKRLVANLD